MNILVTGGAGFIGSHLVDDLMNDPRIRKVRVIDDLSTGKINNVSHHLGHPDFEFIEGDIRDYHVCESVMKDIDLVSHQAALGSIPRSIENPIQTNSVNINGTLNIFQAAKNHGIKRVVFAASSSTYGDDATLPKVEHKIGRPLSPYALTKFVNELYADVFAKTYNFEYIGLRYFNVFGPRQDPSGSYAAVIPIFLSSALNNKPPSINGDGSFSRDFTYVDNVVSANMNALTTTNEAATNQMYNIACGQATTINQLWAYVNTVCGTDIKAKYRKGRIGDIPHSLADISKAKEMLHYKPTVLIKEGLQYSYKHLTSTYA